jgi:hypothetical protein
MSRCICCDKVFKPKINLDEDGKFVSFDDYCAECERAANYQGDYTEEYEEKCVKELSESINYDVFSVKVLTQ